MKTRFCVYLAAFLISCGARAFRAEEPFKAALTIRDHKFDPDELDVPVGRRVTIEITNLDPLAEEFDSPDLQIEKVIAGHSAGTVHLHELDPGSYKFTGEYHVDTAKGVVIAK